MILFPNAKINIGLNILNRRPDGYHNLQTIFYPVAIKDVLEVVESAQLQFSSSGIRIPGNAEENLCLKVYHLLSQDFNLNPVHIHLHKNIPIGAGLGGGSADAAFLIRLINQKFSLGISNEGMENYARQLGADCAFFIQNKPVVAYEKGDQFLPVNLDLGKYFMVVVMPEIHVSTADAYSGVVQNNFSVPLEELIHLPLTEWKNHIRNDFEKSVFSKFPDIKKVKDHLYERGAIYSSMSGSGASVYGIFEKELKLPELERNNLVFYGV
ncbi:4-(cytidine 5'-diphospho)-2-C-methyl-D-erythritol kinase [Daejeonella oryzae]|uniref:4-(cytidine 5'-diphospho)-2-C-methyl-D-erythritol kinase n=1 Tax=Daejeonella oryzae TaxID=1122943 RepID=UPI000416E934|nr:4-(cytidine 5'-diphospho)-2-C-methyl-D-erythritol kinase [Daejeonella oryzae]